MSAVGAGRPRVFVVLVRPETDVNVGAVARVIRNTGLAGLRLVRPGDWRTVACWRSAKGAHEVLEQAQVCERLETALADAAYVAALSGRPEPGRPVLDVREMAGELATLPAEQGACLVFGPEAHGLGRDELALCGRTARIPSHPQQPSLNLSHAVMVAAHEVFRALHGRPPGGPPRASQAEKLAFLELWRDGLRAAAAMPRGDERVFEDWQRLFGRLDLTAHELALFRHLAYRLRRREAR